MSSSRHNAWLERYTGVRHIWGVLKHGKVYKFMIMTIGCMCFEGVERVYVSNIYRIAPWYKAVLLFSLQLGICITVLKYGAA